MATKNHKFVDKGKETAVAAHSVDADEKHQAVGIGNLRVLILPDDRDTFAYIEDFSGGFPARDFKSETSNNGTFLKPDVLNSRLKVLWVGSGTAEIYYQYLKRFRETLKKLGVKHVFYESPGTSHMGETSERLRSSSL